jgi:hypothetical protein
MQVEKADENAIYCGYGHKYIKMQAVRLHISVKVMSPRCLLRDVCSEVFVQAPGMLGDVISS